MPLFIKKWPPLDLRKQSIRFNGLDTPPKSFTGKLTLPEGTQRRWPVVILIHGTAGPDSRYEFHRPELLGSGMATFEVDFKSNVFKGNSDRPPKVVSLKIYPDAHHGFDQKGSWKGFAPYAKDKTAILHLLSAFSCSTF